MNRIHTVNDTLKEFLIEGAEFDDEYGIPILPPINTIPEDTIDFDNSFSRKIKDCKKLNVNFYIDDYRFERLWTNPDRYIDHLRCFHSMIQPDFSISTGENGLPFALNLYNKYRNHALAWYFHRMGIRVIPSASFGNKDSWDWDFIGLPKYSVISVCATGRVASRAAREAFCEGFYEMCRRLRPLLVILIGRVPEELESPVEIINLKSRNQQINERFKEKEKENKHGL